MRLPSPGPGRHGGDGAARPCPGRRGLLGGLRDCGAGGRLRILPPAGRRAPQPDLRPLRPHRTCAPPPFPTTPWRSETVPFRNTAVPPHPRWKGAALAHCPCASEAGVSGTPAVSHREARQNSLEMPSTASGGSLAGGGGVRLPTPEGSARGSPASQHTFHLRVAGVGSLLLRMGCHPEDQQQGKPTKIRRRSHHAGCIITGRGARHAGGAH